MYHAARNLAVVIVFVILFTSAQGAAPERQKPSKPAQEKAAALQTKPMTVWQARRAVVAGLKTVLSSPQDWHNLFDSSGYNVKMQPESIRVSAGTIECAADVSDWMDNKSTISPPRTEFFKVDLRSIGTLGVKKIDGQYWLTENGKRAAKPLNYLAWATLGEAQAFTDAANRLRSSARGEDQELMEADWREFQQKAVAWRALAVKPAISEDVRKHRLLAENAVKEKQFDDAVEEYEAGLEINPVWPEGHFNAALLSAELGYYSEALHHMRAYLELAPEAPDAQQARDQMVIWEAKLAKAK